MSNSKRLPLRAKIALVAASFSLPILVLVYFVVSNINADIRFTKLEGDGNAYQRPLERLLDDVQQYQLLTTANVPIETDGPLRDELSAEINRSFATLTEVDQQLGTELQFTDEGLKKRGREHLTVNLIRQQWQAISNSHEDAKVSDRNAALDTLVASLREAITHAGDTSNLILDPDLDSYYLMDVTLLALPQTQDRLAKVIAFGRDRLQAGTLSAEDRVQLAVHAALLEEADLARVTASLKTSLNEDANFYGVSPTFAAAMDGVHEEFCTTTKEFIALARQASASEQPSVDPAAFVAVGLKARNASFALWNASVGELDQLLAARMQNHAGDRSVALTGSGVALAVACVLALLMTLSITKPLNALAESLGPGADLLNNSVEMLSETPENADIIGEELSAQVGYMRGAVQELVVIVRGGQPTAAVQPIAPSNKQRDLETAGV